MSKKVKKFSIKKVQLRNFTNQTFKFKSGDICRPQSVSVPLFQDEVIKVLSDAKLDYIIEGSMVIVGEEKAKNGGIGKGELDILISNVGEVLNEIKAVVKQRKANGLSNDLLNGEIKSLSGLQKSLAIQKDGKGGSDTTSSEEAERILGDARKWLLVIVDLTPPLK